MSRKIPKHIYLTEDQMPQKWYNVRADMKEQHDPYINPGTMKPAVLEDLLPVFCAELAKQECDETTRFIDIPEEIQNFYKIFRPSPVIRAYELEKALDTPAHIYYKFEGNNTSGTVGNRSFDGLQLLQYASHRIYGEGQFGAEALPQGDHRDVRFQFDPLPLDDDGDREEDPCRTSRDRGKSRLCDFRSD